MSEVLPQVKNRAKWLKELRSGKHNQCTGGLLNIPWNLGANERWSYCALGVAVYCIDADKVHSVDRDFGLLRRDINKIVHMNDHEHMSFKKIADEIEKMPIVVP